MIDITITSTLRPDVLEETLISFKTKLFNEGDYRIIINIDPVGNKKVTQDDVESVVRKHFDDVIVNKPVTANFSKALIWCWSQCESKYVFNLEDDWTLNKTVDINELKHLLETNDNLASIRLNKRNNTETMKGVKYSQKFNHIIGKHRYDSFSLNPSIIKKEFIDACLKGMIGNTNPETQLRDRKCSLYEKVISKWDYAVYGNFGDKSLIVDIGSKWRCDRGLTNKKKNWTTW